MAVAGNRVQNYLPSAARTATPTKVWVPVPKGAKGCRVALDMTAITATPIVTATIQGRVGTGGAAYTFLAMTAVATVTTGYGLVYPIGTAAAGTVAVAPVGAELAIDCVHTDADSGTYSVNIEWLF